MSDEVNIRNVAPTDFDQWFPLWEGYNVFYKRVGPAAIPVKVTKMTWARFFDSYEPVNALVADCHGQLLGLINGVYDRARAAGSTRVYWHTHETNVTAQRLYDNVAERSGFIVYRKNV